MSLLADLQERVAKSKTVFDEYRWKQLVLDLKAASNKGRQELEVTGILPDPIVDRLRSEGLDVTFNKCLGGFESTTIKFSLPDE